jgi:hypothetical protein
MARAIWTVKGSDDRRIACDGINWILPDWAPSPRPVPPEPERRLSDAAKEYVTWVESYPPHGSQVYTYPINTHLEAAVINADLDGDGVPTRAASRSAQ